MMKERKRCGEVLLGCCDDGLLWCWCGGGDVWLWVAIVGSSVEGEEMIMEKSLVGLV